MRVEGTLLQRPALCSDCPDQRFSTSHHGHDIARLHILGVGTGGGCCEIGRHRDEVAGAEGQHRCRAASIMAYRQLDDGQWGSGIAMAEQIYLRQFHIQNQTHKLSMVRWTFAQ